MNPYTDLVIVSPDEGFELTKAMAAASGNVGPSFWTDQPWLYDQWIGLLFRVFGESAALARIHTTILFLAMIFVIGAFIDRRRWYVWGIVFGAIALSCQYMLLLEISFLLEPVAWSLGLMAFALPRLLGPERIKTAAVISGALYAVALNTKPSVILLIPACLIEIWYVLSRVEDEGKGGGSGVKSWLKAQARRVAPVWSIWAGAAVVVCLIAILIAPNWNWRALVGTHAGALDAEYASPEMYRIFGSDDVLEHIIVMMMAAMACVIAYRLGRFKEMLGPLALVASLAVGHCIVRPWWFYYQVEWALILALLGVIGLRMFIIMEKPDINDFGKRRYPAIERAGFVAGTSVFAALVLVSLLFQGVNRIRGEIKILERSELVDNSPVLAKLDEYKEGAEWLFTTDREYSFYSKIPIPPEVRWLSRKRFLSGQITTEQIVDVVAQYRVRLVLIPHDEVEKAVWNEFLTNNYERVWLDAKNQLWVRKDHLESREVENEKAGNNI